MVLSGKVNIDDKYIKNEFAFIHHTMSLKNVLRRKKHWDAIRTTFFYKFIYYFCTNIRTRINQKKIKSL